MSVPHVLILFRFLLAPTILALAYYNGERTSILIVILMYLGLISDILDGIIARKSNISTAALRRLDSQTDMIFWLSIGFSAWFMHPEVINQNTIAIWIILGMEVSVYLISIVKFKRETCTHAYLSKFWGICLLVAFTFLIGFNHAGFPFKLAIVVGLISHLDRILITLILPHWSFDVPSAYHAYLIRKGKTFKKYKLFN